MKKALFYQNGFPKTLGFVMIIIILSICCCSEYLLAQTPGKENTKTVLHFSIPEVTIVHSGFKLPPRMVVNPIKSPIDINDLFSDNAYWDKYRKNDLEFLTERKEANSGSEEANQIGKVVNSVRVASAQPDEIEEGKDDHPILRVVEKIQDSRRE